MIPSLPKDTSNPRSVHFIVALILICIYFLTGRNCFSQKTDHITLTNGNKITGEVKKLEYGKLTYSTDDLGKVGINWDNIINIESNKVFEIETTQGYLFIGTLQETADSGSVYIKSGNAGVEVKLIDITYIYPIKTRFFDRITGPINVTSGYTKANDLLNIGFEADLKYGGKKVYSRLKSSDAFTRQYDSLLTQRQLHQFSSGKKFRKHWYAGGLIGYEQNSELGLKSRYILGAQFGKIIVQKIADNLNTSLALQGISEYYSNETSAINSLELFLDIQYKHFLYYTPKSDITAELQLFPSLTNFGRVRTRISAILSQEIFSDFFISLNAYLIYDNKPTDIDKGVDNNDWENE